MSSERIYTDNQKIETIYIVNTENKLESEVKLRSVVFTITDIHIRQQTDRPIPEDNMVSERVDTNNQKI